MVEFLPAIIASQSSTSKSSKPKNCKTCGHVLYYNSLEEKWKHMIKIPKEDSTWDYTVEYTINCQVEGCSCINPEPFQSSPTSSRSETK